MEEEMKFLKSTQKKFPRKFKGKIPKIYHDDNNWLFTSSESGIYVYVWTSSGNFVANGCYETPR